MLTRRTFVVGAPFALAGCATTDGPNLTAADSRDPRYAAMYGAVIGEPFPVEAIDLSRVDPKFYRREVAYPTREAAGTIVVDPGQRFAFLVQEGGRRSDTASASARTRLSTSAARRPLRARPSGRAGCQRRT